MREGRSRPREEGRLHVLPKPSRICLLLFPELLCVPAGRGLRLSCPRVFLQAKCQRKRSSMERCLGGRDAAALVGISICVAVCRRMVCVSAAALIGDDGTEAAGEHHCWEQRCAEKFCPLRSPLTSPPVAVMCCSTT
ncbi:uncharacterized protein ODF1 isoform X2 [Gallus gallus]|uniref:uncharacterized protein ODF1 isoform X2 n=1 Tax=Gallus gallus TaxID=9031 RepID=UPI001AE14484|nr:uncharacterized protein ODF1 isoform X2 [Gallus gallus]